MEAKKPHQIPWVIRRVPAEEPALYLGKVAGEDVWTSDLGEASVVSGRLGLRAARRVAAAVGGVLVPLLGQMQE